MLTNLRVALIQSKIGRYRCSNLENVAKMVAIAKKNGAQLVALPEFFNTPFGSKYFNMYAETIPFGPTSELLSSTAKEHSLYIIGGSYSERDSNNNTLYNTCTVWNPKGDLIGKFRKLHLFDIDIPNSVQFSESKYFSAGNEPVTFNIEDIKIGLGICSDLEFGELAKIYKIKGCKLIIYPAGFMVEFGRLYWKILQRARAIDNNIYVCAISPARNNKGFIAWGHSQITDPNGRVIAEAQHDEEIVYADLDFTKCHDREFSNFNQRRTDIYDTILKL